MADKDPKQFRLTGQGSDRRNFEAEDDPLVELARIVSEDGGFYSQKTTRAVPLRPATPEQRNDFSADLEAELMQELEYSLRSREESAPEPTTAYSPDPDASRQASDPESRRSEVEQDSPSDGLDEPETGLAPAPEHTGSFAPEYADTEEPGSPYAQTTDYADTQATGHGANPEPEDLSFDQATASESYQDPAELLRALQRQLGSFGHRVVTPAPAQDDANSFEPYEAPVSEEPARWAGETLAPTQGMPSAGYGETEPDETYYSGHPLDDPYRAQEQPYASSDSDPGENPFLAPEPASYPVAGRPSGTGPSSAQAEYGETGSFSSWESPAQEIPPWEEPAEPGGRDSQDEAGAGPVDEWPLRAPFGAGAAAAASSGGRWSAREPLRPVAANDDPFAVESNEPVRRVPLSQSSSQIRPNPELTEPPDDSGWLTSGHDLRRDLRPGLVDFRRQQDEVVSARNPEREYATSRDQIAEQPDQREWDDEAFEPASNDPYEPAADDFQYETDPTIAAPSSSATRATAAQRQPARRSSRRALTLASLAGLLLIGGAVAAYLRSDHTTVTEPPPVIRAEDSPSKVQAEVETPGPDQAGSNVVYNPSAEQADPQNERIVDNAEEPREVARVVLPSPQQAADEPLARPVESDTPTDAPVPDETIPAQNGALTPIGPRRVRTVVVRPDGTIVANAEAAGAPAPGPAPAGTAGEPESPGEDPNADPLRPNPVRTTAITSRVGEPDPGSLMAEQPGSASPGDQGELESASAQQSAEAEAAPADPEELPEAGVLPGGQAQTGAEPEADAPLGATLGQPMPEADPTPVPDEPAPDLLAESPEAAPQPNAPETEPPAQEPLQTAARTPPAAAPADGFVVQLSSQRTEDQARASFDALRRQFPTVLGEYQPNIQQADLGDKGIFYRVRVGPMADRAEAIRVCEALKAAGGTCFVGK